MKRYLVFCLALSSLLVQGAEDRQDDAETKFDNTLRSMDLQLLSIGSIATDIQNDASSTDDGSLILAATECQTAATQCRGIYNVLNDHNNKLRQRHRGSQNEIVAAEHYGQTILSTQDLARVRKKIKAIEDALPRFTWCCTLKRTCKNDIKDLVSNITSFTNNIEQLHKYEFLTLISQHRLQCTTPRSLN